MAHAARRYDRTARVNEVVREVLADELERLSDPGLGLVTVTGVEVTPDLRQATVYYSALVPARSDAEAAARRQRHGRGAAKPRDPISKPLSAGRSA